jgi:hypothetical protein
MFAGNVIAIGITMAIVVGGVALVELSIGRLQGVFASSDSRQARAAAEAGLDQIIGSWNQPENRKMLVSGTAMNTWASTTTGETLRSPCVSNSGTRPGSNSGQPTLQARSFGDGQFRDFGTGAASSTNWRSMRRSSQNRPEHPNVRFFKKILWRCLSCSDTFR